MRCSAEAMYRRGVCEGLPCGARVAHAAARGRRPDYLLRSRVTRPRVHKDAAARLLQRQ